jgi:hypothetical protein
MIEFICGLLLGAVLHALATGSGSAPDEPIYENHLHIQRMRPDDNQMAMDSDRMIRIREQRTAGGKRQGWER